MSNETYRNHVRWPPKHRTMITGSIQHHLWCLPLPLSKCRPPISMPNVHVRKIIDSDTEMGEGRGRRESRAAALAQDLIRSAEGHNRITPLHHLDRIVILTRSCGMLVNTKTIDWTRWGNTRTKSTTDFRIKSGEF